jgi:hypothetical protein
MTTTIETVTRVLTDQEIDCVAGGTRGSTSPPLCPPGSQAPSYSENRSIMNEDYSISYYTFGLLCGCTMFPDR